jgi:Predicted transcriptional regulators
MAREFVVPMRGKTSSAAGSGSRAKKRSRLPANEALEKKRGESPRLYIVSAPGHRLPSARVAEKGAVYRIRGKQALVDEFKAANRQAVWVAPNLESLAPLVREAPIARGEQRLVVLGEMQEVTHHLLSALFRYVVSATDHFRLLELDELMEVLSSPGREDLFIGGAVDKERGAVLLYRGSVEPLVVPLVWFRNKSSKATADPDSFEVTDFGQTVKLGAFEASADAILYEFDPEYRRRARKRAIYEGSSFGASVRRLRLQKGLSRRDFPGVTEKEIARIERNEITRPHARTLEILASSLGVPVAQLTTY